MSDLVMHFIITYIDACCDLTIWFAVGTDPLIEKARKLSTERQHLLGLKKRYAGLYFFFFKFIIIENVILVQVDVRVKCHSFTFQGSKDCMKYLKSSS